MNAGPPALPRAFAGGVLRRLRAQDLPAFQAYRACPELGRFQGWSPMSDADALAFLRSMEGGPLFPPGAWVQLGIADAVTDRLIGDIGVCLAGDESSAEVGFTLESAAQGRGIASAAVREALDLLFCATAAREVIGVTDVRNLASIRLLERLGFELRERQQTVFRGEACVEATYVLPRPVGRRLSAAS